MSLTKKEKNATFGHYHDLHKGIADAINSGEDLEIKAASYLGMCKYDFFVPDDLPGHPWDLLVFLETELTQILAFLENLR